MTKPTKWLCAQQRLGSAWAFTQSDQNLPVYSMGSLGPKLSSCGQRRLWSVWADAQADLSLRWVHRPFYCFLSWGGSDPEDLMQRLLTDDKMVFHVRISFILSEHQQLNQKEHFFPQISHIMTKPVYRMPYVNNKGASKLAHPCSLISTLIGNVRCLDSIIHVLPNQK